MAAVRAKPKSEQPSSADRPPLPSIKQGCVDLEGLFAWGKALAREVPPDVVEDLVEITRRRDDKSRP